MIEQDRQPATLTPRKLAVMILAAVVLTLLATHCLGGDLPLSIGWSLQLLTDLGQLAILVIAAGGLGYPLVRKLLPRNAPAGLAILTAIGVGLWLLGTLVLLAGTFVRGSLNAWVWWPVTALGVLAALWQSRHSITDKIVLPSRLDGRSLIYVLLAVAAALWVSGATCPPGFCQIGGDGYDVLEYHLQVPREYLAAQQIGPLCHNCYSFYPMGQEMLHLMMMSLRGGAYEGMYLANLVHGLYLVLAVAAVLVTLRGDDDAHGRFSAVLLGTAPLLLYLSYLAMVELSAVFYMVLAMLWLRQWLREANWKTAAMVGLTLGGACATKYLAVGMVALPVLAAMTVAAFFVGQASGLSGKRGSGSPVREHGDPEAPPDGGGYRNRIAHVMLAVALCLLLLSPWLIRNTIYTGNPVFPLATNVFGRGHWSAESQQRWQAGHGRTNLPPVPPPMGIHLDPPKQTSVSKGLVDHFLLDFLKRGGDGPFFGLPLVGLTIIAAAWVLAGGGGAWERALLAVLAMQVALWAAFAHDMPPRFLAIAIAPMSLLIGGMLARLVKVARNPLRKSAPSGGRWGLVAAAVLLVVTAVVNLVTAGNMLAKATDGFTTGRYLPGEWIASKWWGTAPVTNLPRGSRVAMVGQAEAFYFPSNIIYATVFDSDDSHPLKFSDDPRQTLQELRSQGVTHIYVNWSEMTRLAVTYGYPRNLVGDLLPRRERNGPIGLECLEPLGLVLVDHIQPPLPTKNSATSTTSAPAEPAAVPSAQETQYRGRNFTIVNTPTGPMRLPMMSLYKLPPPK